jgi:hypothetical protein
MGSEQWGLELMGPTLEQPDAPARLSRDCNIWWPSPSPILHTFLPASSFFAPLRSSFAMVKEQAIPLAGPSRHQNATKSKKNAKPAIRTSKLKKLTEKQKIDALEKDAMDFVSTLPKHYCLRTRN